MASIKLSDFENSFAHSFPKETTAHLKHILCMHMHDKADFEKQSSKTSTRL